MNQFNRLFLLSFFIVLTGTVARATESPNGSLIPTVSSITDSTGAVWTIKNRVVLRNGVSAASNTERDNLLYINEIFYSLRSTVWYKWSANNWTATTDPRVVSPDGATLNLGQKTAIIDASLAVWSLGASTQIAYVNGVPAGNVIAQHATNSILFHGNSIFMSTTTGHWYRNHYSSLMLVNGDPRITNSPAVPLAAGEKSIRSYVSCNTSGTTDNTANVAKAFDAAKNKAFKLIVDCPVLLDIGIDIAKPIFVEDNTAVEMRGSGKFIITNVLQPAFVFVNTSNVQFSYWVVDYAGSQYYTDINGNKTIFPTIGYFIQNGKVVVQAGDQPVTGNFNNLTVGAWYKNHGVTRDVSCKSYQCTPFWDSITNVGATFNLIGTTNNVSIDQMTLRAVSDSAEGFVATAFAFNIGFKDNVNITPTLNYYASVNVAIPSNISLTNITYDGTIMGHVGSLRYSTFSNIQSFRYSDIQDPKGDQTIVGGCISGTTNCWFAPPHLFYLNFKPAVVDSPLYNYSILIQHVNDVGVRADAGHFTDANGNPKLLVRNPSSGNCLSLKFGAFNSKVSDYTTHRPDGVADILFSDHTTYENINGTYDSSLLANYNPKNLRSDDPNLTKIEWAAVRFRFPSTPGQPAYHMKSALQDPLTNSICVYKV